GLDHVEVLPGATGAGDEVDAARTQTQGFENVEADADLFHRIGGKGNADGVADALGQQHAQTHRRFHRARTQATGLGNAQMQRLLDLLGQQPVGTHSHEHIGCLDADLVILEVQLVQVIHVAHGRLHQCLGLALPVFLLQVLRQRAGVDTDADRNAMVPGGVHHRLDPVFATDVARVDAQAVNAQFGNAQGDPVVEVDIRHQRHSCLLTDLTEGLGGLHGRHRYPDNVRAHRFQLLDLGYRGGDVAG